MGDLRGDRGARGDLGERNDICSERNDAIRVCEPAEAACGCSVVVELE